MIAVVIKVKVKEITKKQINQLHYILYDFSYKITISNQLIKKLS
jgi:hypothetical protein